MAKTKATARGAALTTEIRRMDVREFRELGLLQEVNRLFFHPLGLALEVIIQPDGAERIGGIWDYRDDPEGIRFGDDEMDLEKAKRADEFMRAQHARREKVLGYVIQPRQKAK